MFFLFFKQKLIKCDEIHVFILNLPKTSQENSDQRKQLDGQDEGRLGKSLKFSVTVSLFLLFARTLWLSVCLVRRIKEAMPVIPALRKRRQRHQERTASLGSIVGLRITLPTGDPVSKSQKRKKEREKHKKYAFSEPNTKLEGVPSLLTGSSFSTYIQN